MKWLSGSQYVVFGGAKLVTIVLLAIMNQFCTHTFLGVHWASISR